MIAPQTLSALGVDLRASRPARVMGVTGSAEAVYVMLESLEVGEARVGPIEVLAHHPNMPQGEGLLGRDFLDRFNLNIDARERLVVLSRR
jgi:predicted aspartyl protease